MFDIANFVFDLILAYFSYKLLFFAFVFGIIIPIIPEELILLLAGYLAYSGLVNYWLIIPTAIVGILLADAITYGFGRYKGREILTAFGLQYKIFGKLLRRGEKLFNRYDDRAVIFGRFIVGARFAVPMLAGAFGMRWRRFLNYSLVGSVLWVITAVSVGYGIGTTLNFALLFDGEKIIYYMLAVFAIIYVLLYFVKRKIFSI